MKDHRPDLFIVTDVVYATFADDFVSIFAKCPRNTLCVYSFSKYFGATGWRSGAIALHDDNVFDAALAALPEKHKAALDTRYSSLPTKPRELRFIDRLVADSRAVALNHTAGLGTPQQLQMALFALNGLMDRGHWYQDAAKALIRGRYATLYANMGVPAPHQINDVDYYSLIDLQKIGGKLYGPDFETWFTTQDLGTSYLFRLAKETGVVLLPGNGFEVVDTSARISLANLTDTEYASIGKFTRQVLDEYYVDFKKTRAATNGSKPALPSVGGMLAKTADRRTRKAPRLRARPGRRAPDIRGHTVRDSHHDEIGHVSGLFIDRELRKVRMLEIRVGGFLGIGNRHFLLPVDAMMSVSRDASFGRRNARAHRGVAGYDPDLIVEPFEQSWEPFYGYYGLSPYWSAGYLYPEFPMSREETVRHAGTCWEGGEGSVRPRGRAARKGEIDRERRGARACGGEMGVAVFPGGICGGSKRNWW